MIGHPLKILSVGHADSPQYRERTARFVELGHEVVELTGSASVVQGAKAIIPCGVPAGPFWRLIAVSRIIHCLKEVRSRSFDVVFVHYAKGLWAWLAPLFGVPVAVSVMGGDALSDEQGDANTWNLAATRGLLQSAAMALCKSGYLAERVEGLGFAGKVVTHAWGIDGDIFTPGSDEEFRREHGIPEDSIVVFSPRAMEPLYNTRLVVQAFAASGVVATGARLVLSTYKAGTTYRQEVEQDCRAAGLDGSVVFLPFQDAHGMARAFNAADVAISIPSADGVPPCFFESTACGTPLIMAALPNYSEYFTHGTEAWLTALDGSSVAEGIRTLCRDAGLRRSLVQGARETATRLNRSGGDRVLDERLQVAALAPAPSAGGKLRQAVRVMGTVLTGQATARVDQPVFRTVGGYFKTLQGKER